MERYKSYLANFLAVFPCIDCFFIYGVTEVSYSISVIAVSIVSDLLNLDFLNFHRPVSRVTFMGNLSIIRGIVPDEMKIARAVPLFKSQDKALLTNYRPVSVLTCFSRFLEQIVYNRIPTYLNFDAPIDSIFKELNLLKFHHIR